MENEKRLIDAWDLIEWLDNFDRENTLRILSGKKAKLLNSHAIRNMIVTVPTVDAVEVVHGEWTIFEDDWNSEEIYECSVCKEAFVTLDGEPMENLWKYCPNCGAKMRGSE